MVPPMAPSRMVGRPANSSSSGIFFQGDGQSQVVTNSYLTSAFGNCGNSIPVTGHPSLLIGSGDMNNAVLNIVANSGPNFAASSLVTDANSALPGVPHLRRSASINTDTYMRLPASPMSYSSNQISISGSSIMDGSSAVQQVSHQSPSSHQVHQSQQHHQGASSATSLPISQMGQVSLPTGPYAQGSFIQDPNHLSQVQKKPRLDIKQEDIQQQQAIQHLLQRQDPVQLHPLQALIQQQRFRQQQQQILQSMPPIQLAHLQQQQKMQLRHHLPQQGVQPVTSTVKRPFDAGICSRRLMQYLYHQRQRPPDSSIAYWRKFVAEYYSPRAKKRWCLSLYDNVGQHALGVFPQAAMDAWQCDVCKSKSGRGFEATFEVLPRLYEIKFSTGVIDELLFLDLPHESRFPSGIMVLEYAKAVQESVYEQLRVVREGRLRIMFTPDLKILNWEFCARRHEELLPRRFVAPQVSQLVHAALKCQSTIPESGSDGTSQQDLQSNSNMVPVAKEKMGTMIFLYLIRMFTIGDNPIKIATAAAMTSFTARVLAAGHQLAKSLELQSLNDLGFSKRYVRCLQIAEVVNSMKDLINFCRDNKAGPIEGLKNYPRHASAAKIQMQKMQEMEQLGSIQGLPTDRSTLNKLLTLHPGMNGHIFNNQHMNRGSLGGYAQASLALTNNQNLLTRQNSNSNSHQVETFSSFSRSDCSTSTSYQGQGQSALKQGSGPNVHGSGFSSPHPQPQQQQQQPEQQRMSNATNGTHPQAPQGGQALQQHMIQQLLQEMHSSTGQAFPGQTVNGSVARGNGVGFGNSTTAASASSPNVPGGVVGPASSRSNSFKAASNSDSSPAGGINNNVFNPKSQDLPQSLRLSEELVQDIAHDFADNGFFNGDLDDSMSYVWKD